MYSVWGSCAKREGQSAAWGSLRRIHRGRNVLSGAMSVVGKVGAFVRLGRPLFLTGGFVLYALGAAAAASMGAVVDGRLYVAGQVIVTSFQLMTHYGNDYFDVEADRANATPARWSGGSRVLPAGELPPSTALAGALAFAAAGLLVAGCLAISARAGPFCLPLSLLMFALAWEYSAPPLRLHSTGLGEIAAVFIVTILVPLLAFYLQSPGLGGIRVLLLALAPLSALQFAMLLAVEFPDAASDASVGKRTLVVRLGQRRGAILYSAATAAAFAILPILVAAGLSARIAVLAALLAPAGAWRAVRVAQGEWSDAARWERLTFCAVFVLMMTASAELAGFLWLIRS
jgi:1,4-dihydroxy-2-naphthoate octaprenyltransferase